MKLIDNKRILILLPIFVFSFITTTNASTLNTFTSNYDADVFQTEQIAFQTHSSVPQDWYPLKDTCKYLLIDVSWDNTTRELVLNLLHILAMKHIMFGKIEMVA